MVTTKTTILGRRRFITQSALTLGAIAGAGSILDACNTSTTASSTQGLRRKIPVLR